MASIDSSKEPLNWEMLTLRAKAAEIEGRKPDALMMYRSAMDMRGPITSRISERDKLADNCQRLWKEMGGTEEGMVEDLMAGKSISFSRKAEDTKKLQSAPD